MEIKFTNFDKNKPYYEPKRATSGSSGFDLCSIEDVTLMPGQFKLIDTNIAVQVPHGMEGQVRSRSGLAAKCGVFVLNSPGTIDSDFIGSIGIILMHMGNKILTVNKGDRIAQLVFAKVSMTDLIKVDELVHTTRGSGGFGSTGVK